MNDWDMRELQYAEHYRPTRKVIMVPVVVDYHDATDVVYNFPPTTDDVEEALKQSRKAKPCLSCTNGENTDEDGKVWQCGDCMGLAVIVLSIRLKDASIVD